MDIEATPLSWGYADKSREFLVTIVGFFWRAGTDRAFR
jgi:hypothetical protein